MKNKIDINPSLLWHGLLNCDRETLAIFCAFFEDSKSISLIQDKLMDFKDQIHDTYKSYLKDTQKFSFKTDLKENFSRRIEQTSKNIKASNATDDDLRIKLWKYLLSSFQIDHDDFMSKYDILRQCDDIANNIIKNVSLEHKKSEKNFIQRLNPFNNKDNARVSFPEAIDYFITKTAKEAVNHDPKIAENIEKEILKVNPQITNLTTETIHKTLLAGGSLLTLMGSVQTAGFSAYILAAQASAIIPFIGGKTLVSLLFIVANPIFVIPAIIATGAFSSNSLEKSIKQSFSMNVSSMLVMHGLTVKNKVLRTETFLERYNQNFTGVADLQSKQPFFSDKEIELLNKKICFDSGDDQLITQILPSSKLNIEDIAISALTFSDFIYDIACINPHIIEATDFARKIDISDSFDFSLFSESLMGLSKASLAGHHANIIGYTAERIVASELIKNGHIVEIPDSAAQPGYDLLVDGHEFQVKCIKPENFDILERHFDKYPNTPVLANSEIFDIIQEKHPEWSDLVFYINGFTHENTSNLVTQALDAGQALNDFNIISSIAIVSTVNNIIDWKKGNHSFNTATFNIFLDSVSKGSMALVGGVAGASVGMFLFGPAGYYILGGISTAFGASQGNVITNQIDKILDPEREVILKKLADDLLNLCNKELYKKIDLINKKMEKLSNDSISSYIKYRFMWEVLSFQIIINRNSQLTENISMNGQRKIFKALKLASESTIHPYCLQKIYKQIANILNQKIDRLNKTKTLLQRVF